MRETKKPAKRIVAACAALLVLVAANVLLRRTLEHSDQYIFNFFDTFFPAAAQKYRSSAYNWWQWLLPNPDLGQSWSTTSLVLANWIETKLTAPVTWQLLNVLVVIASFVTGLMAFDSLVFACTLALALGFGTQLYQAYATSGPVGLNLLIVYFELLLFCGWRVLTARHHVTVWRVAFVGIGFVTALAYEGWLDILVFIWAVSPIAVIGMCKLGWRDRLPRFWFVFVSISLIGIIYILIKTRVGYGNGLGAEADVVFNYPVLAPAAEDVFSNALTHLYTVITNFLPASFLSSTALYSLGPQRLIDLQYGYHRQANYLVAMHYLFLWRYYAGIAAATFVYVLIRTVRTMFSKQSADALAISVFMVMMFVGGPTHAMIKFRPMKSAPVLGYQVLVGVIGGALLISYLLMMARRHIRSRALSGGIVIASWIVLGYGSLTRPMMLSHLAAQVGLGEGLYPDPWRAIESKLGITFSRAAGDAEYMFVGVPKTGYGSQDIRPRPEGWFGALETRLPDSSRWQVVIGRAEPIADARWRVYGDGTLSRLQFVSPRLEMPPNRTVTLRLDVTREQGRVCVGLYDRAADRWIRTPETLEQTYTFYSGGAEDIRVAVTNCDMRRTENADSVFVIGQGSYDTRAE